MTWLDAGERDKLRGELDRLADELVTAQRELTQARADLTRYRNALTAAEVQRDDARARMAAPPAPKPLAEYHGLHCPSCRWTGYDDTHEHRPLLPVTVAIVAKEAA